jgi:AraC family transcriptional regulator, arabinose operon regulatory protein
MSRADAYCPPAAPIAGGRSLLAAGGNTWRGRGIADWLLWYTHHGACRITAGSRDLITSEGEAVLMAPRTPHDYGSVAPGWGVVWAVFQPPRHWHEWLRWPEIVPGVMRLRLSEQARPRVLERLDAAQVLARGNLPGRDLLAMNSLEAALLWCRTCLPDPDASPLDARVKRVVDHMCEHLHEPIDLRSAARIAGVSAPHLARLFSRHLGTSVQRFLEERRLERARQLLIGTALPVQRVAEQTGFASPFYFSLRFKRRCGLSPSEFRRRGGR